MRERALEQVARELRRKLAPHDRRRSGYEEPFVPAAPSGTSASPEVPPPVVEFPDVLLAPHAHHEPITPAHCGHLTIGFIDDWIHAGRQALVAPGPPAAIPQRGSLRFTSLGVPTIYGDSDNAGDGSCLIHAFLMATSILYRNLSVKDKGILGRAFRHKIYARLYHPDEVFNIDPEDWRLVPRNWGLGRRKGMIVGRDGTLRQGKEWEVPRRRYTEYVGGVGRGRHHGYLYDTDVEKLARCFNVNILLVPSQATDIRYYEDDTAAGHAKPSIMIRQRGAHYTTLHVGDQYLFSREEVLPIVQAVNRIRNSDKAGLSIADRTRYAIGRRVFVIGHPEERIIMDIRWSDAGALPGQAVKVSHVILETGGAAGQTVPVANIRLS